MNDSGSPERQADLTRFSGGGDERDAEAEARAVAGGDRQRADSVVDDADWLPDADGELELSVMQVDYTVEGSGDDEEPVVHVFGRRPTDDGQPTLEHVHVHEFEPYFYAPAGTVDDERIAEYDGLVDYRETDADGEPFESIRGERLVKVIGRTPRDVGQVRDEFDHYEADILFPDRLLIDKDVNSGVRVPERRDDDGGVHVHHEEVTPAEVNATPRINTFDIEVDDRQGFPEDGEETIVCLTSHDSYRDEYVNWLYRSSDVVEGPDALADYEPIEDDFEAEVKVFESEEEMLAKFVEYIEDTDPDILTGWNVDDFDAPYLIDRMERLQDRGHEYDLDVDRLSRVNEVWRSDWNGPDVKGRVVFDLLRAYKSTQRTELESYRLDAVGEVELGVGKERYSGDIGDLWEDDPERLLEYNLRDVELCVELDRKQDIVAFFEEVASFVGCKLEDAPTAGDAVDMYVLHKAHGEFALPSKGTVESGEEFEGGAVFEPIRGVRENVSVLDLKSLYPMCMWTVNASPETKVDPDEYEGETYRTPTGQHFKKEPAGMMREMIDELLTEREEKKNLRDQHDPGTEPYERFDNQQASVKVVMNSLYGVSGWDRFRLYDKDNAAAVTATGREVINYTEESVNDFGYDVIYGDTDSVMLEIGDEVSKAEAIENSFELEKRINESYDAFASERLDADEHRFQIEFEKLYRRFFQAGTKKRYAGHIVWKEGKDVDDVDITGFEYKRSDIAPITKEVQKEVIDMIVHGEDTEAVKEYVADVIEDYQSGNVNLDDVGIPGGIGKRLDNYDTDTAQVRGAKYANLLLGTNFQRGSKPKRLYLDGVHPDFWQRMEDERGLDPSGNSRADRLYREFKRDPDVICFEFADQIPEEFDVDWDEMLDKTLEGPIERIIEALGVSWKEVKTGQEQTGLGSFV
ncbi:DNA-directed DNA polymerase [Halorussus halobius]|uniref:DNA-directed DNA polymerase n=1 Tax=Halorussus halobius TaxID=1710537 RepID=UPI0010919A6A|nr:DNA-directed DNA polymerase [Halorussus halobius]